MKVRRLLTECLKKEPEERLRWVRDAGRLLEEPAESRGPAGGKVSVAGSSLLHKLLWPVAAEVLAVAAATVSFGAPNRRTPKIVSVVSNDTRCSRARQSNSPGAKTRPAFSRSRRRLDHQESPR